MNVQVKRAFKSYFLLTKKIFRNQRGSAWNFLQLPIKVYRGSYIPYLKINVPIFCCYLSLEEYFKPQVKITQMVNEHTVDYHPSPSELTSRIYPLIFLWTPEGFIPLEYFLNFFSNLYIPPWLGKSFKFMVLRLMENTFVTQNIESVHFYLWPLTKFSLRFPLLHPPSSQKKITPSPNKIFWKSIFSPAESGERLWSWKLTSIKSTRVLVTSFNKFHNLCNLYIFASCFVVP